MHKNQYFTGQPIFNQLLSFIPKSIISKLVVKHQSDRYYKRFFTYDHLVSMLYCCFHQCQSIREVITGLQVSYSKLNHLGLEHVPRRSTLAEANSKRTEAFFEDLFHALVKKYYPFLPDSRKCKMEDRILLMDSTTVKLFSDVMKGAGTKPVNGKAKGGMKAHVLMSGKHDIPQFVKLTHGVRNDKVFLKHLDLKAGDIIVFDMGYVNYHQYQRWTKDKVNFVTRLHPRAIMNVVKINPVSLKHKAQGVISDRIVELGTMANNPKIPIIKARLVRYYDQESDKDFTFLTNNMQWVPTTIASLYKQRWQVELLFKRIKQAYPLKYFLGESENAIKIQMWCALIADLLMKLVKDKVQRKWSFSNIVSMIRLHLMTYIDVIQFLRNPDKALFHYTDPSPPNYPQKVLF